MASRLYTRLVAGALFPLHEKLKGHETARRLRGLEETQWYPGGEVQALQLERLRRFLTSACEHVPYYRQLFEAADFSPGDLSSVDDLAALPLLDKALIRRNREAMTSSHAGALTEMSTGGSTGEPLRFLLGRERKSHDIAAKWRATRWWGVDIGDPEIVVWGSPVELGAQDHIKALRDRLFRTRLLPAFALGEQDMDRYLASIAKRSPRMLFGYPSALSALARHGLQNAAGGTRREDRVTFCTGERLYPEQREEIAAAFGGRVANGYGAREAGFIAHECPTGKLHVSAEDIVVEIVDSEGRPLPPGESGEVVVTHMATADFPFIRYRTGDHAALDPEPCPCGRGLPALTGIEGRSTDFVVDSEGRRMHGLALIYVVREQPGVRAFRIEQQSRERTTVYLVADDDYAPEVEADIRRGMQARLGPAVSVDLELVHELPPERSGKYRYVISHAQ
ncbi:MAG: phenylacetate--CoA ligase family protein [Spiribacter salinus]|uniref:Phenylacetate--CoA ligase family protein n=1 Tax=Spiribacter salinus TaxID=1335746 RepID=A0A540VTN2_9GAMM|nr:MAG: phenylacetate--CoA ligase family protein [Spiribacter salinus]